MNQPEQGAITPAKMPLGSVDYGSSTVPENYRCGHCAAHGVRLFRIYSSSYLDLLCRQCALDEDKQRPGRLDPVDPPDEDESNIGSRVAAVPTPDGDTFWGYTSIPLAGVEWWFRLPVKPGGPAGQPPKQQKLICYSCKKSFVMFAAEYDAHVRKCSTEKREATWASYFESTVCLVEAGDFETLSLWREISDGSRWFDPGYPKIKKYRWDQLSPGLVEEVGRIDGRPVTVELQWARVRGQVICFWSPASQVVDYEMARNWLQRRFPTVRTHVNAMNFHNALNEIDRQTPITRIKRKLSQKARRLLRAYGGRA